MNSILGPFSSFQSLSHGLQHTRPPCPSPTPSLLNLMSIESMMPSNRLILCHPLSSCLQSFPASGSFQMSQFFAWGSQSIGVSTSGSVLPINIQNWFPLGWIGWISLQSKGLSRVFSNTTVQKHQFFSAQLSFYISANIHSCSPIFSWHLNSLSYVQELNYFSVSTCYITTHPKI